MVLWVNLHGAFVLGLALVALYIGCESCRRFIDPSRTDALEPHEIRKLILILILCLAATILNPQTYKVYDYIRTVVSDPASQQYVMEWQPPRVNQIHAVLTFYGPFFLGLLAFILARVTPDFTETVLFFTFGILGMTAIRNAAWFSIVGYPIIARYLALLDFRSLLTLRRFAFVQRLFDWAESSEASLPVPSQMNTIIAMLGLVVLVAQSPWLRPTVSHKPLIDEQTPVGAANFIEQHQISGHIFHPQIFGDYLIWRLWPKQKSFIDGRVHLFDLDFVRQSGLLLYDSHWEDLLAQWNIQCILLSKLSDDPGNLKAIQTATHSTRWNKLYEDDISVLFEKLY